MVRLVDEIKASAIEWGVSPRLVWWIFWAPLVGAMIVGMARLNKPLYDFLTREDGPIEWAQFLCYAGASVMAASVSFKRVSQGYRWQGLLYAGLAFATFFIAGEEIAWGQRIFGLQTPEQLAAINHQREITVHNIQIIQDIFNVVLFLAGAYGITAHFANKRLQLGEIWDQAQYLFVPPLFVMSSFFVLFAYKLVRFVIWRTPGFTVTRFAEWPELCFAFALFLFTWLNYQRLSIKEVHPVVDAASKRKIV
jgi:hypothetical protein